MEKITAKFATLDFAIENKAGGIPLSVKKKWAAQIEHTVAELHKKSITWGDAKPGNIMIGEHDDAWLIDFGGGFTMP